MVLVGQAVGEAPLLLLEWLHNLLGDDQARERYIAARHALGHDEDVRLGVPVHVAHLPTGAAEPGHDLVGDPQHSVAVADLADRLVVAGGRGQRRCRGTHDRLGDERRDVLPADALMVFSSSPAQATAQSGKVLPSGQR